VQAAAYEFLETVDADALLPVLRRLGETDLLLRLGDAESAGALVEHVRRGGHPGDLLHLAEVRTPEVEAFLRATGGLGALAVRHGLPAELRIDWEDAPEEARDLVREGRPTDALAAWLEAFPDATPRGLGLVEDGRVRRHLERLRDRRGLEARAWALGELTLMGDEAARAEYWSAMREGRYRWVDEAGARERTLGHDLSTIPFWISELETNCCRFNVVASTLEDLFGHDFSRMRYHVFHTAAEVARNWWEHHGGRFAWSRIGERFVPAPR